MKSEINGNENKVINIQGNNNGIVFIGDKNIINGSKDQIAEYGLKELERFDHNKELLKRPVKWLAFSGVLVGIGLLADLTTLLDFTKVSKVWIWIPIAVVLWVVHFIVRFRVQAWFRLIGVKEGNEKINEFYYIKNEKGITEYLIAGKCPVLDCDGELLLKRPKEYPNNESIEWVGYCNRRPDYHIFDFNEHTFLGNKIEKLTKVKK